MRPAVLALALVPACLHSTTDPSTDTSTTGDESRPRCEPR
jgi:hypothetical protein